MPDWLNHVAIDAPRNGTSTHTVTPSSGTVAAGSLFTPTAGRLLVCLAVGGVTSSTPSGWTLPAGGSAVNNCGHYLWYRTAAGSDSFTTTHNASNYAVMFDFYEFAATSTFLSSVASASVANGGAGPTVSGLTGTHWTAGTASISNSGTLTGSYAWDAGVEAVDYSVPNSGTDGYLYGLTAVDGDTAASRSYVATGTITTNVSTYERLVFAFKPAAAAAEVVPNLLMAPHR